jgi:RNA polymerase sigma-70 factor (ECF subfamily)
MQSVRLDGLVGAVDVDGFPAFFEESLPRVYAYLLSRCGGEVVVAEDLCQETFLAAVRELRKGGRVESPAAWIFGIARHKLVDHYRRRGRTESRVSAETDVDVAIEPADDDTGERAVAALRDVPAAQRAVLVLHYMDGFSVAEVAATIDRSLEAVESLLARGRRSFKIAYQEASQ